MMRIFVAGATGVIGVRLVPLLVEAGHAVAGMTRTPGKAAVVEGFGATPVLCDVYDGETLTRDVRAFAPEMVIHQLTDLPSDVGQLAASGAANSRMRREGTRNLLVAAAAADARRFLAQSIAWEPAGDGVVAKAELERTVLEYGGVVIRYGQFYGPGTYYEDAPPDHPRIHVDIAAQRTLEVLELDRRIVTIAEAE
jgi:nucleoside-diphosphate-sugar epimerase